MKVQNLTEKIQKELGYKRITVFSRCYTHYYTRNYSKPVLQYHILINASDKKATKQLEALNRRKVRKFDGESFNITAKFFRGLLSRSTTVDEQIALSRIKSDANDEVLKLIDLALFQPLNLEEITKVPATKPSKAKK